MKKIFCSIFLVLTTLSFAQTFAQTTQNGNDDLKRRLTFLADEKMKGRAAGTKEDREAAKYIAHELGKIGFVPVIGESPLVNFEFTIYREVGYGSKLIVSKTSLLEGTDFSVLPESPAAEVSSQFVFIERFDSLPDNLKGKVALIQSLRDSIPFKVTALKDKGVSAIIFFSNEEINTNRRGGTTSISVPAIQISANTAAKMLASDDKSIHMKSVVHSVKGESQNVIMRLKGVNAQNSILIGAHYDHIGIGGAGSGSMAPKMKEIHNGADDNASGVAAAIEIGKSLAEIKDSLKYNIIVAAFGAEERGILGSRYAADTLKALNLLPKLMINLDMVGRLSEERLQVGGTGTFKMADSVVNSINRIFQFKLATTKDGYGPSDHASFYTAGVPVLYFTTGVHKQYHTPFDDVELINFPGLAKVSDFVTAVVKDMATSSVVPEYQKVTAPSTPGRASFKITLGLIPDFTYEKGDGFRVGSVTDGKPAQKGGMMAGDIITSINSKDVLNIYDYMARLGELKAGEKVEVKLMREGKKITLNIEL
jgi:hypothetical protein